MEDDSAVDIMSRRTTSLSFDLMACIFFLVPNDWPRVLAMRFLSYKVSIKQYTAASALTIEAAESVKGSIFLMLKGVVESWKNCGSTH